MSRNTLPHISSIYGMGKEDADNAHGSDNCAQADTDAVPQFVMDAINHGLSPAAAGILHARIQEIKAQLDAGLLSEAEAIRKSDKVTVSIYVADSIAKRSREALS